MESERVLVITVYLLLYIHHRQSKEMAKGSVCTMSISPITQSCTCGVCIRNTWWIWFSLSHLSRCVYTINPRKRQTLSLHLLNSHHPQQRKRNYKKNEFELNELMVCFPSSSYCSLLRRPPLLCLNGSITVLSCVYLCIYSVYVVYVYKVQHIYIYIYSSYTLLGRKGGRGGFTNDAAAICYHWPQTKK